MNPKHEIDTEKNKEVLAQWQQLQITKLLFTASAAMIALGDSYTARRETYSKATETYHLFLRSVNLAQEKLNSQPERGAVAGDAIRLADKLLVDLCGMLDQPTKKEGTK